MTVALWFCLGAVVLGAVAGYVIDVIQERQLHRTDDHIIEAELRRLIPEAYEENAS